LLEETSSDPTEPLARRPSAVSLTAREFSMTIQTEHIEHRRHAHEDLRGAERHGETGRVGAAISFSRHGCWLFDHRDGRFGRCAFVSLTRAFECVRTSRRCERRDGAVPVERQLSSVDPKIMYGAISNVPREAADDVTNGAVVTLDEGGARLHRLPTR
jgi:hypothetical protein